MSKSGRADKASEVTQDEPTAPRPVDSAGRELDEHGLPISGPARIEALDGRPDPALAGIERPEPIEPTLPPPPPPAPPVEEQ